MASSATQPLLYLKRYDIPEDIQKAVTSFLLNVPGNPDETQIPAKDIFVPRQDPSVEGHFARICLMLAMNALADISYNPWITVRRSFLNLRTTFEFKARPLEEVNSIMEFLVMVEVRLIHYTREVLASDVDQARRNWLMNYGAEGAPEVTTEEIDLREVRGRLVFEWDYMIRNIGKILPDWDLVNKDDLIVSEDSDKFVPENLEEIVSEKLEDLVPENLEELVSENP